MDRTELIRRAKAILSEAYDEAAVMVMLYLDSHPSEALQTLCKEIDPDNWNGLRRRVDRAREARKAAPGTESERALAETERKRVSNARSVLRDADPTEISELVKDLPASQRAAIAKAAIPPPDYRREERAGPSFIDLIIAITSRLIELEGMVASWHGPEAIPAEFSRDSFSHIAAKALRIQDAFDRLADVSDDDEFQKIVENFRVVQ